MLEKKILYFLVISCSATVIPCREVESKGRILQTQTKTPTHRQTDRQTDRQTLIQINTDTDGVLQNFSINRTNKYTEF